jgi:hypothetical protein
MFSLSESRIDWFALEREHGEDAFVHAPQWLAGDKALKPFQTQCELAARQRSFGIEPAPAQPHKIRLFVVVGTVNDA